MSICVKKNQLNVNSVTLRKLFPVYQVKRTKNGLRVLRKNIIGLGSITGEKREKITHLSPASLRRLAFTVFTSPITFSSLMTLTYSQQYPHNGKEVKSHLNAFLIRMRRSFGKFGYVWFLEFQERRAPHVHLMTTLKNLDQEARQTFAHNWARAAKQDNVLYCHLEDKTERSLYNEVLKVHTHPYQWELIRLEHGAKWYVLKYATKPHQKTVPRDYRDVGRFWGTSRDIPASDYETFDVSEEYLREMLERMGYSVANSKVLPKYINLPGE
jgi:hypothetical protein